MARTDEKVNIGMLRVPTPSSIQSMIQETLSDLRDLKPSRETSLVATKLEEALMWAGKIR